MAQISLAKLLPTGKPLTISQCAFLLACFSEQQFANALEYQALKQAVEQQSDLDSLPCIALPTQPRVDPRPGERLPALPIKFYTDYEMLIPLLKKNKQIKLVDEITQCDFAHLVSIHIKDFLAMKPRVSSFPYEGGFVRKDLLPLVVRQYCYANGVVKPNNLAQRSDAPFWWLPCFDLSTEFHLFVREFERGVNNTEQQGWIIKPNQGARGKGHVFVLTRKPTDIKRVCMAAPMFGGGGDKIAQQLVIHPLCVRKRKFDLRVFAFVRSFSPFEVYMPHFYYARLANKEYDLASVEMDSEVALTVSGYNENKEIASKQERLTRAALRRELLEENPTLDFDGMMQRVNVMLTELFSGVGRSVGTWPRSSAYYSVDVLFDNHETVPLPKLLEVNFMGDVRAVESAMKMEMQEEGGLCLQDWVDDLVTVLATNEQPKHCVRL